MTYSQSSIMSSLRSEQSMLLTYLNYSSSDVNSFFRNNSNVRLQDDIDDISLTSKEIKDHIVEGQCLGAHVKQATSCTVCNNTVQVVADKDIVTCERCKISLLKSAYNNKLVCHLTMKATTGKLEAFTCLNDGLQSFLVSINNDININNISHEELEKLLPHAGKRQIIVDQSVHVIQQFLL